MLQPSGTTWSGCLGRLTDGNPLPQPVPMPAVVGDHVLVGDGEAEFLPQPLGDVLPNPLDAPGDGPDAARPATGFTGHRHLAAQQ